eukprot:1194604-Prorocentrum_minimum.AAC.2
MVLRADASHRLRVVHTGIVLFERIQSSRCARDGAAKRLVIVPTQELTTNPLTAPGALGTTITCGMRGCGASARTSPV